MQLDWEENRVFCKTIGVSALPLVKMYTSSGEVESFPCGPKKIELLRAKLDEWAVKLDTSVAPPAVADEISSGSPDNMSMQQQEQQAAAKLARRTRGTVACRKSVH